ncbi:MAG: Acetolactate synthase, large subunit [Microgenomates group bacterium GW2011_GWA2_47_8]|nr:MAG: Acetolactate synthase, large subunit [Microgenomates group bacterium GW2011_GWA2_47_8]
MNNTKNLLLTGGEAIAVVLKREGINTIFAYPGTSELMLCNAIQKSRDLRLINGRGDKESAFMAAGAGLIKPLQACALLHGARGLTNACGAIADIRRNEISTVILAGLPSLSSQSFLPPHGEDGLINTIGKFSKSSEEITSLNPDEFIEKLSKTIIKARETPYGPVLLGVPQDVLEKKLIPADFKLKKASGSKSTNSAQITKAAKLIKSSKNPLILVDDYLFKTKDAVEILSQLSLASRAPVLQVFYGRGPMLFEKIRISKCPSFLGYYKINEAVSAELMKKCGVLITIEDRNMYPRVVGKLPSCKKIAITSFKEKSQKNKYLKKHDILIEGNTSWIMKKIILKIDVKSNRRIFLNRCSKLREMKVHPDNNIKGKYSFLCENLAGTLGEILKEVKNPVVIDDSQMFGGMIAKNYDFFPDNLRVFGDHGAFVGAGISFATGLAITSSNLKVLCLLGDQAFVNGFQGLSAAVENKSKCIFIVLNNGESVSLFKQALSQDPHAFSNGKNFLKNIPSFSYTEIAKAIGLVVYKIENNKNQMIDFKNILLKSLTIDKPVFIEIEAPSNKDAWQGIWITEGNETR